MSDFDAVLKIAHDLAAEHLDRLGERPVWPRVSADELIERLPADLQDDPVPPEDVAAELAAWADPGLAGTPSGRFFGYVIGGTHPAALAADWLTSAWDQNGGLRGLSPAAAAAETVAGRWLLDLFDLPRESSVGFTTGATMATFAGLAAGRHEVLRRAGWDLGARGMFGAPPIRVLVGADRHDSVDLALRYLGIGSDSVEAVDVDDQGRIDAADLARHLRGRSPTVVCLQAGEVHTGAFDPFGPAIAAAHDAGAWVHVDGAFGLWARAGSTTARLAEGVEAADSWSTDNHKTLNVPYDNGVVIVADRAAHLAAFSIRADYLVTGAAAEPFDTVPELSRRARGFTAWATLRSLGRAGVRDLVDRLHRHAAALADGIAALPGARVVNDVTFTQVIAAFGDDATTDEVGRRLLASGIAVITPAEWRGRRVQRISVSNHATSDDDVRATLAALASIVDDVRSRR